MIAFTLWDIVRNLLIATGTTIMLSIITFGCGAGLGLICLVMRVSKFGIARWIARIYVELFQGTPLLMQMFLAYFGLGLLGFDVPAWAAAGATLICWTSAFLAEIWRGCVEAVPKGQWEASASLGLRFLPQMRLVVLPQALRLAVPPTVGFMVQVVKATALTSVLGYVELSRAAVTIANATYQPATVYGFVALIYFGLNWPLSQISRSFERRLHAARGY